jgi:hypothetical protein
MNFITWNQKPGNGSLFTINEDNIPEFTDITLLVDIVERENYGNKIKPVLKIFTLIKQKDTQTKTIRMEKYDYKMVPIIKTHAIPILKTVGETALKGANNIGKDSLEGVPFKESVENRFNLDEQTQKSNIKTGQGSVLLGSEVITPLNN